MRLSFWLSLRIGLPVGAAVLILSTRFKKESHP
jgi:hypothetical protein